MGKWIAEWVIFSLQSAMAGYEIDRGLSSEKLIGNRFMISWQLAVCNWQWANFLINQQLFMQRGRGS